MKKIYALIGNPVSHSLSPVMQNAAFAELNIDAEYIAVDVKGSAFPHFARDARKRLAGFNVTVPHKSAIAEYMDVLSKNARLSNSVNTVKIETDGTMYGDTTDGYGLEAALNESFGFSFPKSSVTFLGCGGVVQALAFYLASAGASRIYLLNRTLDKAEMLAQKLRVEFPAVQVDSAAIGNQEKVWEFLSNSALALQCTSLGLKPDDPPPIAPDALPEHILLYDTIYKRTKLIEEAEKRGIRCANGLGMLLHQGAKSFSIWTGKDAPLEVMREALFSAYETQKLT